MCDKKMCDKKMCDKKMCDGCDTEVAFFKLSWNDTKVLEYYCADCMGNIVKDAPEFITAITPILEAI